ncbi:MAG: hypothetical protein KDA84_09510 [Planctomycetaceae bacterium]|nr:hypothetical protein [Planctomycetaceae bacterium]
MKIGGIVCNGPRVHTLPLPFGDSYVVFKAVGVADYKEFNELCPRPEPPVIVTKDGQKKDWENENYLHDLRIREERRGDYLVVKSLEPSEIEWENVKLDTPKTWGNYEQELKDAGFNVHHINKIVDLVAEANCLSEEKLEWAREAFQHGRLPSLSLTPSQPTEPETTPSGEPVSG